MRTDVRIHEVPAVWAGRLIVLGLLIAAPVVCHAQPGQVFAWGESLGGRSNAVPSRECMAVAAGGYHSLALLVDGSLMAWGENSSGQCNIPYGNNFVAIAAGMYHSLALRADGTVIAWGDNSRGQCSVPRSAKFRAIAAGTWHSLAIRMDGSIAAWGWNEARQCDPPPGKDYVEVAGGYYHSLALRTDGTLVAWGGNGDGQSSVPEGRNFVHIAAGTMHSLAVRSDGTLVAWGRNSEGQCKTPSGNNFIAVAAGSLHNLALRRDGRIEAWGQDNYGQCAVPEGGRYAAISAGNFHSLAIRDLRKQFTTIEVVPAAPPIETSVPAVKPRSEPAEPIQIDRAGLLTNVEIGTPLTDSGLVGQTQSGLADLVLSNQIPDADSARTENLLHRLEQQQRIPSKPIETADAASPTKSAQPQVKDPNAASAIAKKADPTQAITPATIPAPVSQASIADKPTQPQQLKDPNAPRGETVKAPLSIEPDKPAAAVAVAEPNKPSINFDDPASQGFAPGVYIGVIENAAPVYHFVSTTSKRHFCTISEEEKYKILDTQPTAWKYQGIAFFAYPEGQQPEGARPVYRFWSDSLKQHFYTMDEATKDMMIKELSKSWKFEGIAWYAPAPKQPGQKK